jgi:hypothetical protein
MLTNPEPDRNIEEANDDEIYSAIHYLDRDIRSWNKQGDDIAAIQGNDDHTVVICVCLYLAVLGCLAAFWLYFQ